MTSRQTTKGKPPVFHKMLRLATSHLTEDTCTRWLDSDDNRSVNALDFGGDGWQVAVNPTAEGVPEDLRRVMAYAHKNGCEWIGFDCDAPVCEDLPTYDWGLYAACRDAITALADLKAGKIDAVPPEVVTRLLQEARYHDIAVEKLVADAGI
jgi:hypothetical protein